MNDHRALEKGSPLLVSSDFAGETELQALRIRSGGELALEKELDELVTRGDYWTDEKVQIRVREISIELYGTVSEKELAGMATDWDMVAPELVAERDRLEASNAELVEALAAIVDFCDDPHGSEKVITLALGLAGLLPEARAAIAKANPS